MYEFIKIMSLLLVLVYIGCAIWMICKSRSIVRSIEISAGFLCGALLIIPIVEAIAWVIVIALVLVIIGCFSN